MWKCAALAIALIFGLWCYLNFFTKNTLTAGASIRVRILNVNSNANETNIVDKKSRKKIKHHVPKFMLELYEKSLRGEFDGNYTRPDIVRSVIPKSTEFIRYDKIYRNYQDNHLLIFEVPSVSEDEEFVSADLKILTVIEIDEKALSGLERIVKLSIYDDKEKKLTFLEEVKVHHRNNTWLSFNLTAPVNALIRRGKVYSLLKILISIREFLPYVRPKNEKFKLSLLPLEEDFEHDYPVLLLAYSSSKENGTKKTRRKRNLGDDYEEETGNLFDDDINKKGPTKRLKRLRNTCRRKALYVDFAEIQYDLWIVQPSGYEAYQCHGKCFYPVAEHLSPTKHAIVQALLHSVSPSKATRSCCVPTKLDSISVLYVDGIGVLTYRYAYKDMVVTECGCR